MPLSLLALGPPRCPLAFYHGRTMAAGSRSPSATRWRSQSFGQVTAAGVAAELIAVWWLSLAGAAGGLRAARWPGRRTGRTRRTGRGPAVTRGRGTWPSGLSCRSWRSRWRGGWRAVFLAAAVPVAAGPASLPGGPAGADQAAGEALADTLLAHTARGERARIARELHDVVAHHISMIAVLAETGRLTTPGLPDAGARRFTEIGDTARAGLTEMRRLLGVLREDAAARGRDAGARIAGVRGSRQPQPGLAQLTELIDAARDASLAGTRLIISGPVAPLDPGVELAAYRIVQEALTNARRHAPGAAVDVELRYSADAAAAGQGQRAGAGGPANRVRRPGRRTITGSDSACQTTPAAGWRARPGRDAGAGVLGGRLALRGAGGGRRVPRRGRAARGTDQAGGPGLRGGGVQSGPGERAADRVIVVADDHEVVRAGFAALLDTQPDFTVLGTAADGAEAVRVCRELRPDVVLMDVRMPGTDGIEATRRLTAGEDPPKVLILTTFDLDEYVFDALRAGASGFLLKDVTAERLFEAVRVVAAGEALLAPAVTRRLISEFARLGRKPLRGRRDGGRPGALAALTRGRPRCCAWSPRACPTPRSPGGSSSPRRP